MKIKPYKQKCNIEILLDGKKFNFKSDLEVADIPLSVLLDLREKLRHPKWYIKMFSNKYIYYEFALEDVNKALNKISITTEYKYLKEVW